MKYKHKNNAKIKSCAVSAFMCLAVCVGMIFGAADMVIPKNKTVEQSYTVSEYSQNVNADILTETQAKAKVFGIPLKDIEVSVVKQKGLIPSGSVFGVKFFTKGVMIVGMSDVESVDGIINPAYTAGLRTGDIITKINGNTVNTVEEVGQYIDNSKGEELKIEYERDGAVYEASLTPVMNLSSGDYKSGLWVRDSTAGIGTITYYDPSTGNFAGLGHGICDVDTGKLMPMLKGNVVDITVNDIVKGLDGEPGEIKGIFGNIKKGELYKNTEEGVFGNLSVMPQCAFEKPVEIGLSNEVCEGEAYIYASLGDDSVKGYKIKLVKIYRNGSDTKNFIFEVTDPELLQKTGGIIQGMSGSPIVQNGKLIGAVTHVLVNNPHKGYGIFIENMLSQAESNE